MGCIQLKMRVKFTKVGYLKYLSHLDLVRLFIRAFSRANIPIKFSEGFNPHPRFSIGNPLPLGTESLAEYMDVELSRDMDPGEFIESLNEILPKDIQLLRAQETMGKESLSSSIKWSLYDIRLMVEDKVKRNEFKDKLEGWREFQSLEIYKKKKKGKKKIEIKVDILPLIKDIEYKGIDEDDFIILESILKSGDSGNLKPIELVEALDKELNLNIDLDLVLIKRLEVYAKEDGINFDSILGQ